MRHHNIITCCIKLTDLKSNDLSPVKTALCQINPTIIVQRIYKSLLVGVASGATK